MVQQDKKKAIKKIKTMIFSEKQMVDDFRKKIEAVFASPILPNKVECKQEIIGGITCDVLLPEVYSKNRSMLYIHGGSFIGGSCASWRSFCASIAHASCTKVILPEIRLAPKFPYPAALEDAKSVIKEMYTTEPEILIGADGSGALIALALALAIKGSFRTKLKELILFSPWLDVSADAEAIKMPDKKSKDPILTSAQLKRCSEMYTFTQNLTNPLVSPMYASPDKLEGFPEVYIQMAENERLLPDVECFQDKLRKVNVPCTIDIWKDMIHMFQMADEYLEESHLAIEQVGKHIRRMEEGQ
jgi:acetyl esterase/lipase